MRDSANFIFLLFITLIFTKRIKDLQSRVEILEKGQKPLDKSLTVTIANSIVDSLKKENLETDEEWTEKMKEKVTELDLDEESKKDIELQSMAIKFGKS